MKGWCAFLSFIAMAAFADSPTGQALWPPCQNLADQEQTFAAGLSAMHQCVFCSCFSANERAQAMAYMSVNPMNKTTGMTRDMAVEMTLKNCRGMQNMPPKLSDPLNLPPVSETPPASPKKRSPCYNGS